MILMVKKFFLMAAMSLWMVAAFTTVTLAEENKVVSFTAKSGSSTIGYQYYVNNHWSIDSQVSFYLSDRKIGSDGYSQKDGVIGIGAAYHWDIEQFKPYIRAMIHYEDYKIEDDRSSSNYAYDYDNYWTYELGFGVEYPISKKFSIIGETGLYWSKYDYKNTYTKSSSSTTTTTHHKDSGTESAIKLAYHF